MWLYWKRVQSFLARKAMHQSSLLEKTTRRLAEYLGKLLKFPEPENNSYNTEFGSGNTLRRHFGDPLRHTLDAGRKFAGRSGIVDDA